MENRGAFYHARPTSQRPVELTKENGTTLFDSNKIPNRTEASHLPFDRNFDYFSVNWGWKGEFLKMERIVSVGPDRSVKEGRL